MNLTLLFLTHSSISHSPMISNRQSMLLNHAHVTKCFSPVTFNIFNNYISNSHFSRFMSSVVVTESDSNIQGIFWERPKQQPRTEGGKLKIFNSIFENCTSNERGGAIHHRAQWWVGVLEVSHSIFRNCSTKDQGGAIFFVGKTSSIQSTCGYQCHAKVGCFLYIFLNKRYSESNSINYTSTELCHGRENANRICCGQVIINNYNSSSNRINFQGAGLYVMSSQDGQINISFASFKNNSGRSLLKIMNQMNATLNYIDFIGNTVLDTLYGMIDYGREVIIKNSVFLQNNVTALAFNGNKADALLKLIDCVLDCPASSIEIHDQDNVKFEQKDLKPINSYIDIKECNKYTYPSPSQSALPTSTPQPTGSQQFKKTL